MIVNINFVFSIYHRMLHTGGSLGKNATITCWKNEMAIGVCFDVCPTDETVSESGLTSTCWYPKVKSSKPCSPAKWCVSYWCSVRVQANKYLVMSCSEVFEATFSSEMIEAQRGLEGTVRITDVEPYVFRELLRFTTCYSIWFMTTYCFCFNDSVA